MADTYTLHVAPYAAPGDPGALERTELVRDGFSWGAFLVPALWYAWHRQWLAALAALAIVAVFGVGLRFAGLGFEAAMLAQALLHLLHGLEGPSIRRWLLARAGRPVVDIVQGASAEEAELKSFGRWLAVHEDARAWRANPAPGASGMSGRRDPGPVIGLFPDAEGRA